VNKRIRKKHAYWGPIRSDRRYTRIAVRKLKHHLREALSHHLSEIPEDPRAYVKAILALAGKSDEWIEEHLLGEVSCHDGVIDYTLLLDEPLNIIKQTHEL